MAEKHSATGTKERWARLQRIEEANERGTRVEGDTKWLVARLREAWTRLGELEEKAVAPCPVCGKPDLTHVHTSAEISAAAKK